jgi:hypothetical protein
MIDDTRLMQLWHTGEAAASIARRTGERADSILARWRQLQRAALLPEHARPPMQQDSRDGRPQAGDRGDPLLEKLISFTVTGGSDERPTLEDQRLAPPT